MRNVYKIRFTYNVYVKSGGNPLLDLLKKVLDIIGGIFSLILIIMLVGVFAIAVPFVLLVALVVDTINRSKYKKRGDSDDSEYIE